LAAVGCDPLTSGAHVLPNTLPLWGWLMGGPRLCAEAVRTHLGFFSSEANLSLELQQRSVACKP
jgi:hypothetical protein